ncbi:hypothetical protein [Paenibacillus nuruki]|uniref:hypothetical protein n=1 Tax=Paenibacillus nuruki TaxID=1886670 RepID=UPI00084634DF|nr:hypothetical protein [Paenibacillus nuruki]
MDVPIFPTAQAVLDQKLYRYIHQVFYYDGFEENQMLYKSLHLQIIDEYELYQMEVVYPPYQEYN